MRQLGLAFTLCILLSPVLGRASEVSIPMQIKKVGQGFLDKSMTWDTLNQEATVRMSLVPIERTSPIWNQGFSLNLAKKVEIVPGGVTDFVPNCDQVTHWQFDYEPGLPDYLIYLVFKGPNCAKLVENLDTENLVIKFHEVTVMQVPESVDVTMEIVR